MKREAIDFFYVEDAHLKLHERLENWARYVEVRRIRWSGPIWRLGKSNGRQWHQPELRVPVNTLDGHAIEKAVSALPEPHRSAIRWSYVIRCHPAKAKKALGLSEEALYQMVRDGRSMLLNRKA